MFPHDRRCRSISLTQSESLGGITTFEREFGAIFEMLEDANERLRALKLQTGVMLVLTAI